MDRPVRGLSWTRWPWPWLPPGRDALLAQDAPPGTPPGGGCLLSGLPVHTRLGQAPCARPPPRARPVSTYRSRTAGPRRSGSPGWAEGRARGCGGQCTSPSGRRRPSCAIVASPVWSSRPHQFSELQYFSLSLLHPLRFPWVLTLSTVWPRHGNDFFEVTNEKSSCLGSCA